MTDTTQNNDNSSPQGQDQESEALKVWMAKRDKLASIEITRTLEALGASPNQDRNKSKWKVQGVGNIIVKGQSWFNGNLQFSGFGSVQLVRHAMDLQKDTEAMEWLAQQFPDELKGDWKTGLKPQEDFEESSFRPPERFDEGLNDVRNYLINQRGLPPSLVEREIEAGRLYATHKWDRDKRQYGEWQAVFIGPSSAEIRSTDPDGFKGCCEGSDSERSGYQVMFRGAHNTKIVLAEAAIDALSHAAADPGSFVLSTNGAGRFELQYKLTLEAYRNGFSTEWGFDADTAGDVAAQRVFNGLYLRDVLSEKWGVTPEQIDEWMLQKKLVTLPKHSPHELFLTDPSAGQYAVFEAQKVETLNDKGKVEKVDLVMVDTGTTAKATIEIKVLKTFKDIKRGHVEVFELDEATINNVLETYHAKRTRPLGAKDWNEAWKRRGPKAVEEYEHKFRHINISGGEPTKPQQGAQTTPAAGSAAVDSAAAQEAKEIDTATDAPARKATGRFVRTPR